MIDPRSVLALGKDVRYRVVGGEAVVISQRQGMVFVLNPLGARILQLLDGSRSLEGVADELVGEYEVDRPRLARDLLAFAAELEAAELIGAEPGARGGRR